MDEITKIAIISDIHANKYALDSCLQYIDNYFQVEKILNLGDFVHIGPHPKEVAEIVFSDNRFVNVIGNNEMIVLGKRKHEWHQGIENHRDWTIRQLGAEYIEKIKNIPTFKKLIIHNKKILMLHSHFYDITGRSIQDNLLLYENKNLEEFLQDYPKDVDIVLVGHSHEQLYISWRGRKIINPGSISITWKPITSFCLMEIGQETLNITFKNIPYDSSRLKEDYIQRNVSQKKFLMKFFYPFL